MSGFLSANKMCSLNYNFPVAFILLKTFSKLLLPVGSVATTCSIIYSRETFRGNKFVLQDFDQSVNTRNDYRDSIFGWWESNAIQVQNGCKLNLCNDTYFQGTCQSLTEGDHYNGQFINPILSTNCTCARECKCSDTYIPQHRYGRAYLEGGCDKCEVEYIELSSEEWDFPAEYKDQVTSFVLRKGCNLTIYSESWRNGEKTQITTEIAQNYNGSLGSYVFHCNDTGTSIVSVPSVTAYPMIDLPQTDDELFRLFASSKTLANHPGIRAAVRSLENGRSARSAYILMIGTGPLLNFDICSQYLSTINECHIPITLPELGITNAQLHLIYAEAIGNHDELYEDYRWIASLDEFLSNHNELKDRLPNAIIIRHYFDDEEPGQDGSLFQRKLEALSLLRTKLLDENYSNVMFLLRTGLVEPRNPQNGLEQFEKAIRDKWPFPLPNHLIPFDIDHWNDKKVKVNGNWKMADGELFPRNAHTVLKLICKKGGDPLGEAIFEEAFKDTREFYNVSVIRKDLVWRNHSKVDKYHELYANPFSQQILYKDLQTEKSRREMQYAVLKQTLIESQMKIEELQTKLHNANAKQRKSEKRVQNLEVKFFKFTKMMEAKFENWALKAHTSNSQLLK